jgi:hypothetical protein
MYRFKTVVEFWRFAGQQDWGSCGRVRRVLYRGISTEKQYETVAQWRVLEAHLVSGLVINKLSRSG